ncbi:hypothetical protein diail_4933 [Diaporthe ilicicola]|nr:hypothetical protein diail_4933 [Diaporthe ilicicola]
MIPKQILLALIPNFILVIITESVDAVNKTVLIDPFHICHTISSYHKSDAGYFDSISNHLRGLKGNATLGHQPGGGWCWRYSCEHSIGIYACNDNESHNVQLPWSTIADYAHFIKNTCARKAKVGTQWRQKVLGQAFDADGWNVIVGIKAGTSC